MAPDDMRRVVDKIRAAGNDRVTVTERGASFGYHNLVVDMRSILGSLPLVIGFFALMLVINGAKMCVTVANGAMRADIAAHAARGARPARLE